MMNIAVCDDEIIVGAEIEHYLIRIFNSLQVEHDIDIFLMVRNYAATWKQERTMI